MEEIVAVYPADFVAADALTQARKTLEDCDGEAIEVTTLRGKTYSFRVAPGTAAADGTVLWSLRGAAWTCDNALVAAYNAAIEITTCGAAGGLDTAALAAEGLERIESLANSTM